MVTETNLVKYRTDVDDDFDAAEKDLAKGGQNFFKAKIGKNRVRALPAKMGSKAVVVTHEHFLDMDGMEVKPRFNCPRLMAKRSCACCGKYDELMSSGNPADAARAKKHFRPRKRVYMNVIDRADPESGPKVYAFGQMVFEQMAEIKKDRDAGGNFFDPSTKGFDLVVSRTGSGQNDTKYKVFPSRKQSALADDVKLVNEWIEGQQDLSRYAVVPDSKEINDIIRGTRSEHEEADDDDDFAAGGKPSSTADRDAVDADFTEAKDAAQNLDGLDELDD